ncbi:MAG: hypothetical protein J0L73_26415 [Verrucomicrobia bacterium]|nr:hypothetical protein [Verrucomicrobiota bacterium]
MATNSPLNWNQRNTAGAAPMRFNNAEDYAAHHAALNSGPTGMHERGTIQSGKHKGQTPDQVYAHYLGLAQQAGYQSRTDSSKIDPGMTPRIRAASPRDASPAPVVAPAIAPAVGSPSLPVINAPSSLQPTIPSPLAASPSSAPVLAPSSGGKGPVKALSPRKPATFEGQSREQFGQQAAARQGEGNAFTGYKVPTKADPFLTAPAVQPAAPPLMASNPAPTAPAPAPVAAAPSAPAAPAASPRAPLNGMQIMTPEVARAAVAADKAQNPTPPAATGPGRVTTLNGKPYKSPLAADMGLPQPGQPSTTAPAPPAAPSPTKPTGAFYAKAYTPNSLKPPMMLAGARAEGGPVEGGKPYLVGEKGPEVIIPAQDATVIPNRAINPRAQRPMALAPSRDWRTPSKPARAARPSLVASH